MDLKVRIPKLLRRHPEVTNVQLAGSRERGDENALSDWDFVVETDDAGSLREDISHLVDSLNPLVGQWDRLGPVWCYMLILKGGVKVDIIVEGTAQVDEPPWKVSAENLPAIDDHFWDWILWLGSKWLKDDSDMVTTELTKMFDHLLEPMGVDRVPDSIEDAISAYLVARDLRAAELDVAMHHDLQAEVLRRLRESGLHV
ncbi:MAG: hypothetical protein ACRDI3_03040 [Actinomycetota bacterium]